MADEELNDSLKEEIEALEAILSEEDELTLRHESLSDLEIKTRIAPLTASDTSRQYVGFYLRIIVNKHTYPNDAPPDKVDLFQVRGLDEKQVEELSKILEDKKEESIGMPVLFDLMDTCKEYLTAHNYPTCPCSICLYHIVEEDSFVKTPCYHYFHSACFGNYLEIFKPISDEYEDDLSGFGPKKPKKPENVLPCPVCREDLPKELWNIPELLKEQEGILQSFDKSVEKFVKTKSLENLQRKMNDLFECQKKRGAHVLQQNS